MNAFDTVIRIVVQQIMLDSYIGTFDHDGLRSLKTELDQANLIFEKRIGHFWAVLDRSHVPTINQAIAKGDSRTALQFVLQQARDFGAI